jgi:hypothetical protein
MENDAQAKSFLSQFLRIQAQWCGKLGSPFYAGLLERAAGDVEAGGPLWLVLQGHEADPPLSALPLRFMGAVHRLVLTGAAPELARFYPSMGGEPDAEKAWPVLRAVVAKNAALLRKDVERSVQTNEVGRAAALVGGFLIVARASGLPLRLLEVGASAGLNLRWDHYRYEASSQSWGDAGSEVVLRGHFEDGRLPFEVQPQIVGRSGCDLSPVDPTTEEGRVTLMSYVWPDQDDRFRLLRGALNIARRVPAEIVQERARDWLRKRLAEPAENVATIVFHSIVMQYLEDAEREQVVETIRAAGARSTKRAPLSWLRMEPGDEQAEIRLTLWPGGTERLLAKCNFHGRAVKWMAG